MYVLHKAGIWVDLGESVEVWLTECCRDLITAER